MKIKLLNLLLGNLSANGVFGSVVKEHAEKKNALENQFLQDSIELALLKAAIAAEKKNNDGLESLLGVVNREINDLKRQITEPGVKTETTTTQGRSVRENGGEPLAFSVVFSTQADADAKSADIIAEAHKTASKMLMDTMVKNGEAVSEAESKVAKILQEATKDANGIESLLKEIRDPEFGVQIIEDEDENYSTIKIPKNFLIVLQFILKQKDSSSKGESSSKNPADFS